MPRPITIRPVSEHVAALTRILRQVDADSKLASARKRRIKAALKSALDELSAELVAR